MAATTWTRPIPPNADPEDYTSNGSPRCRGIKKGGGERCGAFAGRSDYCYQHDPRYSEDEKRQTRAKGGYAASPHRRLRKMVPARLLPVLDRLDQAMEDVPAGRLNPREAQALASLATAMCRVLESGELEEKVRQLTAATDDEWDLTTPTPYAEEA